MRKIYYVKYSKWNAKDEDFETLGAVLNLSYGEARDKVNEFKNKYPWVQPAHPYKGYSIKSYVAPVDNGDEYWCDMQEMKYCSDDLIRKWA